MRRKIVDDRLYGSDDTETVDARDPEDRSISADDQNAVREKMLDKTLADSYPASDPPSSLPDPLVDSLAISGPVHAGTEEMRSCMR
jgi:hypothetical protein